MHRAKIILSRAITLCAIVTSAILLTSCAPAGLSKSAGVTKAEYFAAAQAATQCMRDQGYKADEPHEDFSGLYIVGFGTTEGDEAGNQKVEEAFDKCWSQKTLPTEDKYVEGLALSGAEWEADYHVMITCMEKVGITGLKVGDPEVVVGEAIGDDNWEALMCMQGHMYQLFIGQEGR